MFFRFEKRLADFSAVDQTGVVFRWVLVKLDALRVQRLKVVVLNLFSPVSPLCLREAFSFVFCMLLRFAAGPRLVSFFVVPWHVMFFHFFSPSQASLTSSANSIFPSNHFPCLALPFVGFVC